MVLRCCMASCSTLRSARSAGRAAAAVQGFHRLHAPIAGTGWSSKGQDRAGYNNKGQDSRMEQQRAGHQRGRCHGSQREEARPQAQKLALPPSNLGHAPCHAKWFSIHAKWFSISRDLTLNVTRNGCCSSLACDGIHELLVQVAQLGKGPCHVAEILLQKLVHATHSLGSHGLHEGTVVEACTHPALG
jgi:hypothetical protein